MPASSAAGGDRSVYQDVGAGSPTSGTRGMMLVDSNVIIYAAQPAYPQLRRFIAEHAPAVSAVSYVEVLGYHQLDDEYRQYFDQFFRLARVFPLSQAVLD